MLFYLKNLKRDKHTSPKKSSLEVPQTRLTTKKLFYSRSDSKFLITSGRNGNGYVSESEIIDLSELNHYQCRNWVENPTGVDNGFGGLVGTDAIFCGGYDFNCYKMTSDEAVWIEKMTNFQGYSHPASVAIKNDILWVTGISSYTLRFQINI